MLLLRASSQLVALAAFLKQPLAQGLAEVPDISTSRLCHDMPALLAI